jgi:hypothetical protein
MNMSMRDLSFLQVLFVLAVVFALIWGGLWLGELVDKWRKR